MGTIARVERLLELKLMQRRRTEAVEQPTPSDDVLPAKPRCRDESEVLQKMGQAAFGCCAAPTCSATLANIEQSSMRV